jgi:hypothetical protein
VVVVVVLLVLVFPLSLELEVSMLPEGGATCFFSIVVVVEVDEWEAGGVIVTFGAGGLLGTGTGTGTTCGAGAGA